MTRKYIVRSYLWSADGTIITVDWDQLIDHLIETLDGTLKFVAYCSLRNNAFFYSYNKPFRMQRFFPLLKLDLRS